MKLSLLFLTCSAVIWSLDASAADLEVITVVPETSFIAEGQRTEISRSLETLWLSGRQVEYFISADKFLSRFCQAVSRHDALLPELSRDVHAFAAKASYADESVYQRAVVSKVHVFSEYAQLLRTKPSLLSRGAFDEFLSCAELILSDIDKRFERNFVPHVVEMTIALPKNVEGTFGMDPRFIADPVARDAYQKAIDKNRAFSQANDLQDMLHGQRNWLRRQVEATSMIAKGVDPKFSSERLDLLLDRMR